MATNKKIQKSAHIEKPIILAGIAVVILGCISSIFYASTNQRFITELFPSLFYYLTNFVVLAGGFAAGFLATHSKVRQSQLFSAICYAFLSGALYYLYELLRIFARDTFGDFGFPVDKYVFELGPLIAVGATALLAYTLQRGERTTKVSTGAKWTLVVAFLGYQVYSFAQGLFYLATSYSELNTYDNPLWITVVSFVLHPLVVAAVSYLVLGRVKNTINRILYAVLIGSFTLWLTFVLWDFRTDPSLESTYVFQGFVSIIATIATALLILRVRTAAKH